jgi:hypothetical protein
MRAGAPGSGPNRRTVIACKNRRPFLSAPIPCIKPAFRRPGAIGADAWKQGAEDRDARPRLFLFAQ